MSESRVEIPENFNFASLTFDMSRDGAARLLWYIRRTREISGEGIETRVELDNFVNLLLNHLERMAESELAYDPADFVREGWATGSGMVKAGDVLTIARAIEDRRPEWGQDNLDLL